MDASLTPWRERLANWPYEWRERWGIRANELEEAGVPWIEAEKRAWNETLTAKREAETAAPEPVPPMAPRHRPGRGLFREAGRWINAT